MAVLLFWGRGLFVGGLIGLAIALVPSGILLLVPAWAEDSFVGVLAVMLLFSVGPLSALTLSVGAILLLMALVRHLRSGS